MPHITKVLLGSLPILLAGCVTSEAIKGPNGRSMYYVRELSSYQIYKKAAELCPNGYDTVSPLRQESGFMAQEFECR